VATDRRESQDEGSAQAESTAQRIVASTREPAFATNNEGQITAWNDAAHQLIGRSSSSVLSKNCWEVLRGEDLFGNICSPDCCPMLNQAGDEPVPRSSMQLATSTGESALVSLSTLVVPENHHQKSVVHILRPSKEEEAIAEGGDLRFGPYEVRKQIGSGGMGVVYEAWDPRVERSVAIKILARELADDEVALERFRREVRTAGAVASPGIMQVHDVGFHEDRPFFVMELLRGATLKEMMAAGRIPLVRSLEILIQVAKALQAIHEQGIIHRDVKPSNIFVSPSWTATLADFGLAKYIVQEDPALAPADASTELELTVEGAILGTCHYMSPEQIRGETLDQRTDIYSLGLLLFELFTGMPLVEPGDFGSVAARVISAPLVSPGGLNANLPYLTDMIFFRAAAKERWGRYDDISQFGAALRGLLIECIKEGRTVAEQEAPENGA
jgi:hypothetical protein